MTAIWVSSAPDFALGLGDARVGGLISDCTLTAWLLQANGVKADNIPTRIERRIRPGKGPVLAGGSRLELLNNELVAIRTNLPCLQVPWTSPTGC